MPTAKTRINISVSDEVQQALRRLAARDQMPQATKAASLLETALEFEEDRTWREIAEKRDTKKVRFIPHTKVWK